MISTPFRSLPSEQVQRKDVVVFVVVVVLKQLADPIIRLLDRQAPRRCGFHLLCLVSIQVVRLGAAAANHVAAVIGPAGEDLESSGKAGVGPDPAGPVGVLPLDGVQAVATTGGGGVWIVDRPRGREATAAYGLVPAGCRGVRIGRGLLAEVRAVPPLPRLGRRRRRRLVRR